MDGPRTAEATALDLTAGPLHATAKGTVDLAGRAAELDVTASAPAMTPAPGVSWQSIALDAHLHGPFTKPDATGICRLAGLAAGGARSQLDGGVARQPGRCRAARHGGGRAHPGPKPELLAGAPRGGQADARLDTRRAR